MPAEQAVSKLELPKPVVRMSPSELANQVVGVPVWLWVEGSSWAPVKSSAAVLGALSVAAGQAGQLVGD
ncbi:MULTISPECIES: hypothetical protein [unclassified Kitasatospora]|uniref:hypothetical protein n=1 Tax=unclassified Kitasatospora TaxID=2633591 RepID=UPI0024735BC8|nr:hypothetical protein [Kitasatospora sp. GAS204B]